uniref:Uncharacterized protein n=1 Tax=Rhizophora mucronata TaxID=61149 RepID=A0A2P2LBJ1_RHIMU
MRILTDVMKRNNYEAEPMLHSCGITINSHFTQVQGRMLSAPRLKVGNGDDVTPRNGRWNFNHKKFVEPARIENWAVVNFSAYCDIRGLCRDLAKFGEMKGIVSCTKFYTMILVPRFFVENIAFLFFL